VGAAVGAAGSRLRHHYTLTGSAQMQKMQKNLSTVYIVAESTLFSR